MKKKKLLTCMFTVFAAVACMALSACTDNSSSQPTVTVNIQQETEVLNVLGETTLSISTENATEDVVWSSSDESIATVQNGVVTALNAGKVTITATANGVSDTCVVEVLRSTDAPVLNVSRTQVSIGKDSEYTLQVSVQWLGEDVTDKVALNWMLGAGAQEGIANITPKENGVAVIKGLAVGETEFYVSTTIGDAYVNEKISVTVCDSSVWLDSTELEVGPNGNFLLSMFAIDEDGNPISTEIPSIQAYNAEGDIVDMDYVWSSQDESIVKIENGKLVAGNAGVADLLGVYQGYEVVITVSVEKTVICLEDVLHFELADLKPASFNIQASETGTVYLNDVVVGGLADGKISLDESKYPTVSKELGAREMIVETSKAKYVLTANLYSMLIETPEELDAWHAHAFENGDDGYYVLANNIHYDGVYEGSRNWDKSGYRWANPDIAGFKGVFDGNGYVIDGLRIETGYRGFVTILQKEGVIRNVAFTNAAYSAVGAYVCQWGCGTIENVYVQYAKDATTGYWDKNAAVGGTFMSTDNTFNMAGKMTIKNCFVDASKTMLTHNNHSYIGGYMKYDKTEKEWIYDGLYAKVNDVYVVGPAQTAKGGEAKLHYNDLLEGSANYALYHSAEEMLADSTVQTIISQWDPSFWGVKNGMPTPLSLISLGELLSVDTPESSIYYSFSGDKSVYSGNDYTFTVTPTQVGFDELIVLVNGNVITPINGVYTVENVQSALDIKVVHGYIEKGGNETTIEYQKETDAWKINNAVLASYEGVRAHGNAYISKEYIAYMMSLGYTKLQFTIQPDKEIAVQVLYRYNGEDMVAYSNADLANNVEAKTITIDLTVASELELWGTNDRGSGSKIKDQGSYLIVTELTFSK